jgi:TRAP-type C4-dicarboxylate transport system substrate-binding protein
MQPVKKIVSLLAIIAGMGLGTATAESLRLGDFQSTTHIVSIEGTTRWMKEVEAVTGGKISFEHFPSEQAAKASALLDAVDNGILDAALIGPSYHSDTLLMNSVIDLPGFYESAAQGTEALQKMLAEGPLRDELLEHGVVPIFGFVLPPYQVLSGKQLKENDNFFGLDIRTSGSTQAMTARSLGGNGISLPGPEVYTAIETGRLDAVLFPPITCRRLQRISRVMAPLAATVLSWWLGAICSRNYLKTCRQPWSRSARRLQRMSPRLKMTPLFSWYKTGRLKASSFTSLAATR